MISIPALPRIQKFLPASALLPGFLAIIAGLAFSSCALVHTRISPKNAAENQKIALLEEKSTVPGTAFLQLAEQKQLSAEAKLAALLEAARLSSPFSTSASETNPDSDSVVYNAAIRRIVALLSANDFQLQPKGAKGFSGEMRIVTNRENSLNPKAADSLLPSDQIRIHGLRTRTLVKGVGLPFVAWFPSDSPYFANEPGVPPKGMAIPVTAVLRFKGTGTKQVAELEFIRTLRQTTVRERGKTVALAADYSAPVAMLISRGRNRSLDLQAMFFTGSHVSNAGLFQFQPYEKGKIPVVFVHGLMSRPETWTHALNELLADPEIRERYQFWFFLYPTGLPVWSSAYGLRAELDRFNEVLDARTPGGAKELRRKVVIGHSMGGLIADLQTRDGGDYLWKQFSDTPIQDIPITDEVRERMRNLLYFDSRSDISRVIFIATPHRGSPLALRPIAGFAASLIRLPFSELNEQRKKILSVLRDDVRDTLREPANSIRFLRAHSPLLLTILTLPRDPNIPFHSIVGDRGIGNAPDSSDGIVPYWSSHLPEAATEKIVPSGHGANENPEGIQEVARILKAHR